MPWITNGIGIEATKIASLLKNSLLWTKKESEELEKKNLIVDSMILITSSKKRKDIIINLKHNKVKSRANGTDK